MHYPPANQQQIEQYQRDGFIIVENVVSEADMERLREVARSLIEKRNEVANDWDWRKGEDKKARTFRIVQCAVGHNFPWVKESRLRTWAAEFSTALMGQEMLFWYDQFLGKPPGLGAPTPWHQDEAYWGRGLFDRGITCWMSFHDVDTRNGCMHFVPGGHRMGVIEHFNPPEMASDLLVCALPPGVEGFAYPLKADSVTFHHSKMPHMTTGNTSDAWRQTMAQHFSAPGCQGEREAYPWRVHVDQKTGQRTRAVTKEIEVV